MIQLFGSAWFVVANTEHPEETIRFLDYLVSEENVRLWVEGVGVPPSVAGIDYSQYDWRRSSRTSPICSRIGTVL